MNMFKNNGGFTLVELIVVIAILAILAGVAVPVYSGYISKANEAADLSQLDSIKTAAFFAAVEQDADHDIDVKKIDVAAGNSTVTVYEAEGATTGTSVSIAEYATVPATFKSGATTATWTASAGWSLN